MPVTLEAVDPDKGVDQDCDNHGVETGASSTFVWHHGNVGDPVHDDDCNHDLQGKYGHQGLISLTVTDSAGWHCDASYKGTLSSNAAAAAGLSPASDPVCSGPTVTPPPPPPPPKACKCTNLTVSIAPASIEVNPITIANGPFTALGLELSFKVHWSMTCDAGTLERCRGRIQIENPPPIHHEGDVFRFYAHDRDLVKCRGKCGGVAEGSFEVKFSGHFDRDDLAGRQVPIVILRTCQTKKLANEDLSIAFDKSGRPDRAKSKLR